MISKFDDVIVIDNFLSKSYQTHLEQKICANDFPWYWQDEVAFQYNDNYLQSITENYSASFGFYHILHVKTGNIFSQWYESFIPMILSACEHAGFKEYSIERVRAGLITKGNSNNQNNFHRPHVDYMIDHLTMLYYPMDCDGDTYIFDHINGKENESSESVMRITPKKGQAVFLNGLRYHASSSPILSLRRIVINTNLFNIGDISCIH